MITLGGMSAVLPIWWTTAAITAVAASLWRLIAPEHDPVSLFVIMMAVVVAALVAPLTRRPGDRLVAGWLSGGVASAAAGSLLILQSGPREVSDGVGHWAWAVAATCVMVALGLLVSRTHADAGLGALLDTLTVVVVSLMVFTNLCLDAIVHDASDDGSLLPRVVYLVASAVLYGLLLRLLANPTGRTFLDPWLLVGLVPFLVTGLAASLSSVGGHGGSVAQAAYLLGMLSLTRAAMGTRTPLPTEGDPDVTHGTRIGSVLVSMVAPLLLPPVLILLDRYRGNPISLWEPLTALLLLLAIAYLRVVWTLRQLYLARLEVSAARDAAMEASRVKSAFLATMSHEIRTPMNGVIGLAELLKGTGLDARQRHYADGITTAGESLLTVINDVLDFSRGEAGLLPLEHADFDLPQLLADVDDMLAGSAKLKGLSLRVEIAPDLPSSVRGDASRLRQLLVNLVGNAVKFTDAGEVVVRASVIGQDGWMALVRLDVVDTGIGIDDEARALLFKPFHQADSSTSRRFGGSGLGLAISQQLVTAMGGTISVESTPGEGSTFRVEVPLELAGEPRGDDADPVVVPSEDPDAPASVAGRILLVEDDEINQMVARGIVEGLGYDVEVAANGSVALDRLAAESFDAVLMDCHMPVMDGCETTQRWRSDEPEGQRLPIIAMTASILPEDRKRCSEAGMDDFVPKPVASAELAATLKRWIPAALGRS